MVPLRSRADSSVPRLCVALVTFLAMLDTLATRHACCPHYSCMFDRDSQLFSTLLSPWCIWSVSTGLAGFRPRSETKTRRCTVWFTTGTVCVPTIKLGSVNEYCVGQGHIGRPCYSVPTLARPYNTPGPSLGRLAPLHSAAKAIPLHEAEFAAPQLRYLMCCAPLDYQGIRGPQPPARLLAAASARLAARARARDGARASMPSFPNLRARQNRRSARLLTMLAPCATADYPPTHTPQAPWRAS